MARVLVLNASYEPLSVVSTRRAAVLVLNDKAQMLEATDLTWRAERVQLAVPSVIRLNKFVRVPYGRTVPLTRNAARRPSTWSRSPRGAASSAPSANPEPAHVPGTGSGSGTGSGTGSVSVSGSESGTGSATKRKGHSAGSGPSSWFR